MGSKFCPSCGSENVKEYSKHGVPEIHCKSCGYDSGDKYHDHDRRAKERSDEREKAR